ncbi:hypothetical protein Ddc_05074 [Ditylenchus destructor]|nr:hypothetical protein Ddc_05074 [Ditylenchus destructor]
MRSPFSCLLWDFRSYICCNFDEGDYFVTEGIIMDQSEMDTLNRNSIQSNTMRLRKHRLAKALLPSVGILLFLKSIRSIVDYLQEHHSCRFIWQNLLKFSLRRMRTSLADFDVSEN